MTLPSLFLITLPVRSVSGATCHATSTRENPTTLCHENAVKNALNQGI